MTSRKVMLGSLGSFPTLFYFSCATQPVFLSRTSPISKFTRSFLVMVVRWLVWSCDGWHGCAMAGMGVVQCQVVILNACPPGIDHSATARGDSGGSMNDLC